ncbi:hypothetical protein [Planctomicrobium sp. SH664]|uniref:hypothetical protein n=1 Tax=Planctomicrobium sp. SH664 TaxID=3448125 RepID=UPI003F5B85EE
MLEYPGAKIVRLSEEHGELDLTGSERQPQLGERVTIIPNHICPCVNLMSTAQLLLADGSLKPLTIDARGLLV